MMLNVVFLLLVFYISVLILLSALNWASFKPAQCMVSASIYDADALPSPAVPGCFRNEQQRQLYLAEVLIQQQ